MEFKYDAVPGPSNENLLKSKKFKKDPSIEPSEVIYMQLKRKVISENLLQISIMILIDNIKMIFAVNMSL